MVTISFRASMPRSPTATKLATATFTAWLVTLVAIPAASEVLTLKFAGGGPATLPSIDFLRDHVGDSFRSLSGGKIEISPNLAGDLCTEYECVEAARRHSTDLAVLSCGDMGAFGITLTLLELPFIFRTSNAAETILNNWLMNKLRTGMRQNEKLQLMAVFPIGSFKGIATTNGPVRIPEELSEHSIRVSKSPAEFSLIHTWNAEAIPYDWERLSKILARDAIQGLYVSAPTLMSDELSPHITHFTRTGGIWDCGVLVMDVGRYGSLPPWAAQAADKVGPTLQRTFFTSNLVRTERARDALLTRGIRLYEPTEQEASLWRQSTASAWRQLVGTFDPKDAERSLADQNLKDVIELMKKADVL